MSEKIIKSVIRKISSCADKGSGDEGEEEGEDDDEEEVEQDPKKGRPKDDGKAPKRKRAPEKTADSDDDDESGSDTDGESLLDIDEAELKELSTTKIVPRAKRPTAFIGGGGEARTRHLSNQTFSLLLTSREALAVRHFHPDLQGRLLSHRAII